MNRRNLVGASLGAAVGLGLATQSPAKEAGMDHSKMDHSTMDHSKMDRSASGTAAGPFAALAASAAVCIADGEVCLQHCLEMLATGDKTMAGCSQTVRQMLAGCTALRDLALQKSAFTPRMAAVVLDLCRQCEAECDKHAATHGVCRACRDSCVACAKECGAVRAA
jgi:Cys-rich four helix bundle protein (predicted Tat secretion target)